MAQWSTADRTLQAKIVYYGPAFGGKTTNLESLHRITDPGGANQLITLRTADDRTLFFDLLPFDLGEILGYQLLLKLYTVPGQVRYDTTRQVVLSGADAVVFVADSCRSREDQNRWSLQNLRMNMRAKRLDPASVPLLFQFNKQDLADAASPELVARWFGIRLDRAIPAVATEGRGVVETFVAATRALLAAWVAGADDRTRGEIDLEGLGQGLDRRFAPYLSDRASRASMPGGPVQQLVLEEPDLLGNSVRAAVDLGERLSAESARAERVAREVAGLRRLGDALQAVGASFEEDAIIDAALGAAGEALELSAASLVTLPEGAEARLERAWPAPRDPLLSASGGAALLARMAATGCPSVLDEGLDDLGESLARVRAVAAIPLAVPRPRLLLAYVAQPDGRFREADVQFLAVVAAQLGLGLEKAELYERLARRSDELEQLVASRTAQLRQAYEELRGMDQMKDRFLNGLSHEMRSPLTGILSAAILLRDYPCDAERVGEGAATIVASAQTLSRQLDSLFRVTGIEDPSNPLALSEVTAEVLARRAVDLSGHRNVRCRISDARRPMRLDIDRLSRAVANLIDNAAKFSGGQMVELVLTTRTQSRGGVERTQLSIAVLDDAPVIPEQDRRRIFDPFEQGGHPLSGKPAGVGLGLYEARTIARQHGGELEHRPRATQGNEFKLTVPLAGTARRRGEAVCVAAEEGGTR